MADLDYLQQLLAKVTAGQQAVAGAAGYTSPLEGVQRTPDPTMQMAQAAPVPAPAGAGMAPVAGGGRVNIAGLNVSPAEAWLIQRESGGRTNARNPTAVISGGKNLGHAFGLGQLVDTNRQYYARILGIKNPDTTDAGEQLALMRQYIKARYQTAERAQAWWRAHGWY